MIHRRTFLTGLIAAPMIVHPGILMPIKRLLTVDEIIEPLYGISPCMSALEDLKWLNDHRLSFTAHWEAMAHFVLPKHR